MAFENIQQLLDTYSFDEELRAVCTAHPGKSAIAVCSACGKPLCSDCAPLLDAHPLCANCKPLIPLWLSRILRSSGFIGAAAVMLSIAFGYLLYSQSGVVRATSHADAQAKDSDDADYRDSLFLAKAARLREYADSLTAHGYTADARSVYLQATNALTTVVSDFERRGLILNAPSENNPAKTEGLKISALFTARGKCFLDAGLPDKALTDLRKAVSVLAAPETAPGAFFLIGVTEESAGNYDAAIGAYRSAQGGLGIDLFDAVIQMVEQRPLDRQLLATLRVLTGKCDPAEAQFRLAACFEKTNRPIDAEREYRALLDQYSFSPQAAKAQARIKAISTSSAGAPGETTESLHIVPLKE